MKRIKNFLVFLFMVLPIVFYACEETDNITISPEPQNQMRVVGSSTINKSPDIAKSQIGVQTIAKEV
ncbi:MAG: hypothetical protein ACPL7B_02540, partial [Candidatus Poribacteria bacterium]